MQEKIKNLIKGALRNLEISEVDFSVEHPEDFKNGDYSTNVAMVVYSSIKEEEKKDLKLEKRKQVQVNITRNNFSSSNPRELADGIMIELKKELPKEISKIEIAGAGFINFYLAKEYFVENVKDILKDGDDYGKNKIGHGKKVIVEYSSPNIAKPFTVGHLRSTIIGDALANILIFSGYDVIRDNHIGDWGTQFGKLIVAIRKWGNLEEIEKSSTPIKLLVDLYVRFHDEAEKDLTLEDEARAYFAKLEKKDEEAVNIWKKCVELSKHEFEKIYHKLEVTPFDTVHGESFFEDKMQGVLDDIRRKNIGRESEGAFIVEFPEDKKLPPLLLLKKDGSSLYGLRDLAADKWRKIEYGNDIKIINEVGSEQTEYFKQIFETEEMLGYFEKKDRVHIAHGLYRFKDGKMSTRKGNAIWLDEIITEAEKRTGEINEATKKVVAIGALKFNDLKRESIKDIVFDWEEILNIKGDSGPYLQYSYARAKSILEKAKNEKIKSENILPESWETIELERELAKFPEIVLRSALVLQANHLATYLINLSRAFNGFYGEEKIVDKDNPDSSYKLALTEAFSIVIKNGLHLLGIQAPEKM